MCSTVLVTGKAKFRTRSQFCPLDLDKTTKEQSYACLERCAYFKYNYSVEQIYKLVEDFEVKD